MNLLLVDGTNLVLRYAHAALQDRVHAPKPEDVDRVLSSVAGALREVSAISCASHAMIALDSPGKTWRHDLFPAYKANRPPKSGDFVNWSSLAAARFPGLCNLTWPCVAVPGWEADDIIATIHDRATAANRSLTILSGDSDLLALSYGDCVVRTPAAENGTRFPVHDYGWIVNHYGFPPHLIPYYKALVGEPGDNLPGVRGVGPVKARKLIAEYPAARLLLQSVALPRDRMLEFEIGLRLATLRTDAPVPLISPRQCEVRR